MTSQCNVGEFLSCFIYATKIPFHLINADHRDNHACWIISEVFFWILDSTGYHGVGRENHSSNKDVTLTLQTELGLELL